MSSIPALAPRDRYTALERCTYLNPGIPGAPDWPLPRGRALPPAVASSDSFRACVTPAPWIRRPRLLVRRPRGSPRRLHAPARVADLAY